MVHCIIVAAILIHSAYVLAYQEDVPYQNADDDSMYLYMDTRALKDTQDKSREYDIEARRRSMLDKNFVRLGRRDPLLSIRNGYDNEYDDYAEEFTRPTRSGNEKSDHFVRFGRGRSDFVRFGRDYNRERNKDTNFIRFGRSDQGKIRNKRDTYAREEIPNMMEAVPKRGNAKNFLRFGKSNDHFMRFGRHKDDDEAISSTTRNDLEQRQSELMAKLSNYPDSLITRFLANHLLKFRDNSKCSRSVE